MEPLRAFDELMLYQLTKASSTAQFLERCAGLSPAEAGRSVAMARKLKAMPLTEAAWLAGTLTSGQVRAIVANVTKRLAERYRGDEAEVLRIVAPLDAKDTDKAMQRWANYANAPLDDDPDKPPREDEFFHSETGGRYFSNGTFGAVTGAVIAKAIELAESRQPPRQRHPQPRPAPRRSPRRCLQLLRRLPTPRQPSIPTPTRRSCRRNGTGPSSSASPPPTRWRNRAGAQLLNGPRIDHQAFEALSCTAQLLRLVLDEHGAIRSYEMMPASVTDALFGAVAARDQHCRWPGCHKTTDPLRRPPRALPRTRRPQHPLPTAV